MATPGSFTLTLPTPAGAGSSAFAQALKVCLAAAAYDAPVDLSKGPGAAGVMLENAKERQQLFEPNAIVRLLSKTGSRKPTSHSELADESLIEWEEAILSPAITPKKDGGASDTQKGQDSAYPLSLANGVLEKLSIDTIPSPATIIVFATLYSPCATAAPNILSSLAHLQSFFTTCIKTEWALQGIQSAATYTTNVEAAPPAQSAATNVSNFDAVKMIIHPAGEKIVPKEGVRNVLITSALPYVNNVPHLGNIVGSVLSADVFSRYCKARNYNTLFICGTDEYGTATEVRAMQEKMSEADLCRKYHVIHKAVYDWFELDFDFFGQTSTEAQTRITQHIFKKVYDNGFLEELTTTKLYCESHNRFLADRWVEGTCYFCGYEEARGDQCDSCSKLVDAEKLINPKCKMDGATPVLRETTHLYLKLGTLQSEIEEWFESVRKAYPWSKVALDTTSTWLKTGLESRSVTRDLKWGVPVPVKGYEDKVIYVWFDACIGYVSITANYFGNDDWEKWWRQPDKVQLYQFMGKDNVPFHSIVFPASQLGTREPWTKVSQLSATQYLNYEGGKFSKSRNIGVFGDQAQKTGIPPSIWRYYLISQRPETGDSQFAWAQFGRANNELLAKLGNLVNRILKFVVNKKFYNCVVPDYTKAAGESRFNAVKDDVNALLKEYITAFEAAELRSAVEAATRIAERGNKFIQENKIDGQSFAKEPDLTATVVGLCINLIYLISAVWYPITPGLSMKIVDMLQVPLARIPDEWIADAIKPGHVISADVQPLVSLIDEKQIEKWFTDFGGAELEKAKEEDKVAKQKKKDDKKKAAQAAST